MAAKAVALTYVGPHDQVEAAGLVVKRGESVDVPAAVAGSAPTKDSPGSGLLAQADNWRVKE